MDTVIRIGLTSVVLLSAAQAGAQGVSSRVTGPVGSAGAAASVAGALAGSGTNALGGAPGAGFTDPNSPAGGYLSGGYGVKVGDQVVKFRGAVGVGDDRSNFKAGAAIPF